MTFDLYEIVVPTADGPFEIPWDVIRARTDTEFDAYLTAFAEAESRRIGARLRTLRERQSLSLEGLATLADLALDRLARIETGAEDTSLATIETVLAAMGSSLREFAAMGSAASHRVRTKANPDTPAPRPSRSANSSDECPVLPESVR